MSNVQHQHGFPTAVCGGCLEGSARFGNLSFSPRLGVAINTAVSLKVSHFEKGPVFLVNRGRDHIGSMSSDEEDYLYETDSGNESPDVDDVDNDDFVMDIGLGTFTFCGERDELEF